MSRIHIIGGGLAGLSAALELAAAGRQVTVHEAGPACGGRCRSYFDRELGCRIDNGNHLLLSGNTAAMAYLDRIGARETLTGPKQPAFPFMDVQRGERWTLRPNVGRIPYWVLFPKRRVPGTTPGDYLKLRRLGEARPGDTVAQLVQDGPLYRRLVEPLAVAALNTPALRGSAMLMAAVVEETLLKGGAACLPLFPRDGLSETFVDPALARLGRDGAEIRLSHRIGGLVRDGNRVIGLHGPDSTLAVGPEDRVILAVPPSVAADLLPGLTVPEEYQAIVNLHFRAEADPGEAGFYGVTGGLTEWVFVKPGVVSVTISAANRLVDRAPADLAAVVWPEVARVVGLEATPMPPYRVLKEKRATFAATPAQNQRRPGVATNLANCVLSGDWTATGLPATIEGAIRSGLTAARALRFATPAGTQDQKASHKTAA